MLYKVRTILRKVNGNNNSFVSFEKNIGAANEEQACSFMKDQLNIFIRKDVTIEIESKSEDDIDLMDTMYGIGYNDGLKAGKMEILDDILGEVFKIKEISDNISYSTLINSLESIKNNIKD